MANYRNEFEFRSGLLDALGVEHSEADAKNEERWRAKMLDGLEVEYNQNDVNQFDLFRAKLVEGVEAKAEGGGGGGGSSDFSTAEVQLTIPAGVTNVSVYGAFCVDYEEISATDYLVNETGTQTAILYKGKGLITILMGEGRSATVSGDIENIGTNGYLITGDCTITIS